MKTGCFSIILQSSILIAFYSYVYCAPTQIGANYPIVAVLEVDLDAAGEGKMDTLKEIGTSGKLYANGQQYYMTITPSASDQSSTIDLLQGYKLSMTRNHAVLLQPVNCTNKMYILTFNPKTDNSAYFGLYAESHAADSVAIPNSILGYIDTEAARLAA